MSMIAVLGAGIGGVSQAFEFTPSNPWVAMGWRTVEQITVELPALLWIGAEKLKGTQ